MDTELSGNIKFIAGIIFILIAIIGVVFSICFHKNYLLDIIQSGAIGILLLCSSGKCRIQINAIVINCLLIIFVISSIIKCYYRI